MTVHELRTIPPYIDELIAGKKTFELRRNDRDFQLGDWLKLEEWSHVDGYSGRYVEREVVYILRSDAVGGLLPGYVVMGLK